MNLPTREVIERELRAQFKAPRKLRHGIRPITDAAFNVQGLSEYRHAEFLTRWLVFGVTVEGDVLESPVLPDGGYHGLFAWDGHQLTYLNGDQATAGLIHVLQSEAAALEHADPAMLARLICDTIGTRNNRGHSVLINPDLRTFSRHHKVNEAKWNRVKVTVKVPAISGNRERGWLLRFCTLYGWMHETQQLFSHHITVSPRYELVWHKTLLAHRIFSEIPAIEY